MLENCPGSANLRTPELKVKNCPECNEEIEIFSNETRVNCPKCGFTIYNDIESCIQWCRYAIECVGEKTYNRLLKKSEPLV